VTETPAGIFYIKIKSSMLIPGAAHLVLEEIPGAPSYFLVKPPYLQSLFGILVGISQYLDVWIRQYSKRYTVSLRFSKA
jgi:hypothetical protein